MHIFVFLLLFHFTISHLYCPLQKQFQFKIEINHERLFLPKQTASWITET